jgi:DNA-directed RNA polymerase delta subunit
MGIREDLEKRIIKEQQKINLLKSQILKSEGVLQGLQEAIKLVPGSSDNTELKSTKTISFYDTRHTREGSVVEQARELLLTNGKPMRLQEIVIGLGRENTKAVRASVVSSLSRRARKHQIFVYTGPNEFGLIEWQNKHPESPRLPPEFGQTKTSTDSTQVQNIEPDEDIIPDDIDFNAQ